MTSATSLNPIGRRRGALLLLVLISLSFFILVGTLMLVIATRARTSARAFADATSGMSAGSTHGHDALEESLLLLLRGTKTVPPLEFTESLLEDKYGGATISGTATALSAAVASGNGVSSGFLTLTVTSTNASWPALPGRILTLKPDGGDAWQSFRIMAVDGSDIHLLNLPFRPEFVSLPIGTGTYLYRINGREFTPASGQTTPESYDAYDDNNSWLAQPAVTSGTVSFNRLSFGGTGTAQFAGTAAVVDNDNDGLPDGRWITGTSGFLAPRPSPRGGQLSYEVSYLVLDLDGRININAAGMADAPATNGTYGPNVPLGMGYGVADLDASLIVSGSLPSADGFSDFTRPGSQGRSTQKWNGVIVSGTPAASGTSTASQRRPPPLIGAVTGRYGADNVPGIPGDDGLTLASSTISAAQITTGSAYRYLYSGTLSVSGSAGNAVADLKGQTKVFVTDERVANPTSLALLPSVTFLRPSVELADAADDPYEIRLDSHATRPTVSLTGTTTASGSGSAIDNAFSIAELERVLRPVDNDATTLPGRLALILDDRAEACRFLLTTDSWSSPVLTGSAATLFERALMRSPSLAPQYDYSGGTPKTIAAWKVDSSTKACAVAISPDTAAGMKFNVNRVLTTGSARNAYLRGLYTLALVMSNGTATPQGPARAAQWAVNVLDFRDEDSTITGFEYDVNPFNGWNVDGDVATTSNELDRAVIWGFERPEFLIAETAAWTDTSGSNGQIFANLVRPGWTAYEVTTSGSRSVEALSPDLGSSNQLDVGKSWNVSGSKLPAWQLRFYAGNTPKGVVQLVNPTGSLKSVTQDVVRSGSTTPLTNDVHQTSATISPVAANSHVCVFTAGTATYFTTATSANIQAIPVDKSSSGRFFDSGCTRIDVERLADTTKAPGSDNPYIVVDSAAVAMQTVNPQAPPTSLSKSYRKGPKDVGPALHAFWASSFTGTSVSIPVPMVHYSQHVAAGKPVPWFHWPNRPFVSVAELAIVPSDVSSDVLAGYALGTGTGAPFLASGTAGPILDAVYVPSPFAGTTLFVSGTAKGLAAFGLNELAGQTGQIALPTLREPGRVNVNTLVGGTTTASGSDSLPWAVLIGGTTVSLASGTTIQANPFARLTGTSSEPPATSLRDVLALTTGGTASVALQSFGVTSGSLRPRDAHPFLAYATANRLANTATVTSNVLAVWITLKITDNSPSAPSTTFRRMFAIIDRSIPVGFSSGENLNVRDAIVLKRILD